MVNFPGLCLHTGRSIDYGHNHLPRGGLGAAMGRVGSSQSLDLTHVFSRLSSSARLSVAQILVQIRLNAKAHKQAKLNHERRVQEIRADRARLIEVDCPKHIELVSRIDSKIDALHQKALSSEDMLEQSQVEAARAKRAVEGTERLIANYSNGTHFSNQRLFQVVIGIASVCEALALIVMCLVNRSSLDEL